MNQENTSIVVNEEKRKKLESLLKQIKTIQIIGIVSLTTSVIFVISLIIFILSSLFTIFIFSSSTTYEWLILYLVVGISGTTTGALDIISGALILTRDWQNEWLNKQKVVWGILCIIFLGPISILFFSIKASKIIKQELS